MRVGILAQTTGECGCLFLGVDILKGRQSAIILLVLSGFGYVFPHTFRTILLEQSPMEGSPWVSCSVIMGWMEG